MQFSEAFIKGSSATPSNPKPHEFIRGDNALFLKDIPEGDEFPTSHTSTRSPTPLILATPQLTAQNRGQ